MEKLFKEYDAIANALHNEWYPIILRIVGHLSIGISFTLFGIICIIYAGKYTDKSAHNKRKNLTYLIATAYLTCGLTRFMGALATYHNYAIIDGWLTVITGVMGLVTLIYVPYVIKALNTAVTITEVKETLERTECTMKELKDLTEKYTGK